MYFKVRMMKQSNKNILVWMKTLTLWDGKNLISYKQLTNNNKMICKIRKSNQMNNKMMNSTNIMKVPWIVLTKLLIFVTLSKTHNVKHIQL